MRTEIINNIPVRIYTEHNYELPLFECVKCSNPESYFRGVDTCDNCARMCRCCSKIVDIDDCLVRVIDPNYVRDIKNPTLHYVCLQCWWKWKSKRKNQVKQASKEHWIHTNT